MSEAVAIKGKVQDCGCIALPEELQAQTGLYPGATYTLEVAEAGAAVLLRILQPAETSKPGVGAACR